MLIKTVVEIDTHELDALIEKTYAHPFECVADLEMSNDTAKTFSIKREKPAVMPLDACEAHNAKLLHEFKLTGRGQWITRLLMQDMVNTGVLPEGDYVLEASW